MSTVYGKLIDPFTKEPSVNIPIYLGTYDGIMLEISLSHSPQVYTDEAGYFVFTDVPANDDTFQFTLGIIVADAGVILKSPNSDDEIVFDTVAGEVIDLGILENNFH